MYSFPMFPPQDISLPCIMQQQQQQQQQEGRKGGALSAAAATLFSPFGQ
jgi:hypothetical protein